MVVKLENLNRIYPMKTQLINISKIFSFLVLTACNSNSKVEKKEKNIENKTELTVIGNTDKKKKVKTEDINQNSNLKLLQGKWQSDDDKTNFLVFDSNYRKEIAEGMDGWDDEEFILSDRCMNNSNIKSNDPKEKDSYISCKASDLCWYILSVSSEKLTLQYMGRGNTLIYTRVKK